MPDWSRKLSRALAGARLSRSERDEIARELAGYLDDLYDEARCRGLDV